MAEECLVLTALKVGGCSFLGGFKTLRIIELKIPHVYRL